MQNNGNKELPSFDNDSLKSENSQLIHSDSTKKDLKPYDPLENIKQIDLNDKCQAFVDQIQDQSVAFTSCQCTSTDEHTVIQPESCKLTHSYMTCNDDDYINNRSDNIIFRFACVILQCQLFKNVQRYFYKYVTWYWYNSQFSDSLFLSQGREFVKDIIWRVMCNPIFIKSKRLIRKKYANFCYMFRKWKKRYMYGKGTHMKGTYMRQYAITRSNSESIHTVLKIFDKKNEKKIFRQYRVNHVNDCLDDKNHTFQTPLYLRNALPGILASVGKKEIFFLLDTGCSVNLINLKLITYFEKTFFKLNRFKNTIKLSAHNNTPLQIEEYGVILPIQLRDIYDKTHMVNVEFIVEKSDNLSILGFNTIKELGICPTADITYVSIHKKLNKTISHGMVNMNELKIKPGSSIICSKAISNCNCYPGHFNNIHCSVQKTLLRDPDKHDFISSALNYDPLIWDEFQRDDYQKRSIHDKVKKDTLPQIVEISSMPEEDNPLHNDESIGFLNNSSMSTDLNTIHHMLSAQDHEEVKDTFKHIEEMPQKAQVIKVGDYSDQRSLFLQFKNHDEQCLICEQCKCNKFPRQKAVSIDQYNILGFEDKICIYMTADRTDIVPEQILDKISKYIVQFNPKLIVFGSRNSQYSPEGDIIVRTIIKHLMNLELQHTFRVYVRPQNVYNINTSKDAESMNSQDCAEGLPQDLLELGSICPEIKKITPGDMTSCINNSNPKLANFLPRAFEVFTKTYPHSEIDAGCFANPNHVLDLQVKPGFEDQLPKHAPFPCPMVQKKAAKRITDMWLRQGLVAHSNIKTHSTRLFLVQKNFNASDFKQIKEHLLKNYNIKVDSQEEVYRIDPDYLTDNFINKIWRSVVDARNLNSCVVSYSPLQQNGQNCFYDLLLELGPQTQHVLPGSNITPDNITQTKTESQKTPYYTDWEPPKIPEDQLAYIRKVAESDPLILKADKGLYFSSIDLRAAHTMIPLSKNAQYLLNIILPDFRFVHFIRSSYGLQSIGSNFCHATVDIFSDLILKKFVFIYADDIILLNNGTLLEHAYLIIEVLKRLHQNNVKLSLNKCNFAVKEFKYLGFQFTQRGISVTRKRQEAIAKFQMPKTKKTLMSYLGMITYIRSFYPKFSADTSILTDLVGHAAFDWTEEHTQAFLKIQKKLQEDLHLNYYDKNLPLNLYTDSSGRTGGGVLFQGEKNDKEHYKPILFLSIKYSKHQSALFSSLELEILCLIYCLSKLKYFIESAPKSLICHTDAKNLVYLLASAKIGQNPRMARLATKLALYPVLFKVEYAKPTEPEMILVDTISRQFDGPDTYRSLPSKLFRQIKKEHINHNISEGIYSFTQLFQIINDNNYVKWPAEIEEINNRYNQHELTEVDFKKLQQEENCMHQVLENIDPPLYNDMSKNPDPFRVYENLKKENIILEQNRDDFCREKIMNLELKGLQNQISAHGYRLVEGMLVKDTKRSLSLESDKENDSFLIVIPTTLLPLVIAVLHVQNGHVGAAKLSVIMTQKYFHTQMKKLIVEMVASCISCQPAHPNNARNNPISPYISPVYPFSHVGIDFMVQPKVGGYRYIFLFVDLYSQFVILTPTRSQTEDQVCKILDHIFSLFGKCNSIKSDNQKTLLHSPKVKKLLTKYGITKRILSLAYHPSHNGQTERQCQVARRIFRVYQRATNKNWLQLCSTVNLIMNTTERMYPDKILLTPFAKFFNRPHIPFVLGPEDIIPTQELNPDIEKYNKIKKIINLHTEAIKKMNAEAHNATAYPTKLQVGDLCLYRKNTPPKQGEPANKTKILYLPRLFLCVSINNSKAVIEDLVSGLRTPVYEKFLKKYVSRQKYMKYLPPDLQQQMGAPFHIHLRLDSRQTILNKLKQAGFEIDRYQTYIFEPIDPIDIADQQTAVNDNDKHQTPDKDSFDNSAKDDTHQSNDDQKEETHNHEQIDKSDMDNDFSNMTSILSQEDQNPPDSHESENDLVANTENDHNDDHISQNHSSDTDDAVSDVSDEFYASSTDETGKNKPMTRLKTAMSKLKTKFSLPKIKPATVTDNLKPTNG